MPKASVENMLVRSHGPTGSRRPNSEPQVDLLVDAKGATKKAVGAVQRDSKALGAIWPT